MKKLLLLLLSVSFMASAQQFQWLQATPIDFEMNPDYIGYTVASDSNGNVIMAGFDNTPVAYGADIMGNLAVKKYSADGQLLMSRSLTGNVAVYQIETDSAGNLYLSLGWMGGIVLDSVALISAADGIQPLLVKLDPNGAVLWYHTPVIEDSIVQQCRALVVDTADNVYLGYGDFMNSYIDAFSPSGALLSHIEQLGVRSVSSLAIDTAGNLYTAGSCADMTSSFGGVSATTPLAYNLYVAKYNAAGAFQWARFIEDITCANPHVKARQPDEVYFCGDLNGSFNFGTIEVGGPAFGADFFIARLNANGDFMWVREVPGNGDMPAAGEAIAGNRNPLALDAEGNVFFAGRTRYNIQWNPTTASTAGMDYQVLVLKLDADGNVLFAKTAGGEWADRADGIAIAPDGSAYVSGMANGSAVFDTLSLTFDAFPMYPFLAKLSTTLDVSSPLSTTPRWYPNPTTDAIRLDVPQSLRGRIYNSLGQAVQDFTVAGGQPLSLNGLASGLYFVAAEGLPTQKIVKN
ncbi:MAG TPA: T9SS type A sorting domain-containing protein [Flavobacterium sp.]|nr:T9SS type A sorting domain-containing protein [Flavobacterium sp.]